MNSSQLKQYPVLRDTKGNRHYFFPGPPAVDGKDVYRHYIGGVDRVVYVVYPPSSSLWLAPPRVYQVSNTNRSSRENDLGTNPWLHWK